MATSAANDPVGISLLPSQEETLLREAVSGICGEFGRSYMEAKRDAHEPPRELWDALAARGYMGSTSPRSTGAAGSA